MQRIYASKKKNICLFIYNVFCFTIGIIQYFDFAQHLTLVENELFKKVVLKPASTLVYIERSQNTRLCIIILFYPEFSGIKL